MVWGAKPDGLRQMSKEKEKWVYLSIRLLASYHEQGYIDPMCSCGRPALKMRDVIWDGEMAWEFKCGSGHEWKVRK